MLTSVRAPPACRYRHNVFAKKRTQRCCACPYAGICWLPIIVWLVGLAIVIPVAATQTYCFDQDYGWGVHVHFCIWDGEIALVGGLSAVYYLVYVIMSLLMCIVRITIRKQHRIPERYTGRVDAGCCCWSDCKSCSCCEDYSTTCLNPLLCCELKRMLHHVVSADKHSRYISCSPSGTHLHDARDDIEAGMPLNDLSRQPASAQWTSTTGSQRAVISPISAAMPLSTVPINYTSALLPDPRQASV